MTENSEPIVAGLLLAAGGSSRLGRPKQLVEFEGKTLIRRAAEALLDAGCSPVIVVLGAEIDRSTKALEGIDIEIVVNEDWQTGMGSSIAFGMDSIIAADPDAVLIYLCDQPFITAEKLRSFIENYRQTERALIAAQYGDVTGVPALFSNTLFQQLLDLKGAKGAREIIRNSPDAVTIPLPDAGIDVDNTKDVERYLS